MSESRSWLPEPSEATRPFFEGAAEGVLRLQSCAECGRFSFPLQQRCRRCGAAAMAWSDSSGRGTVYAYARLQRAYHPRHEGRLPLTLVLVDLEEGVRMPSNLVDAEPGQVRVGMAVEVTFEELAGGAVIPVFRPAGPELRPRSTSL